MTITKTWDGKAVKELRDKLNISQAELGKRISEVLELKKPKFAQQIVRWEKDINKPSEIYCKALDKIASSKKTETNEAN